MCAMHDLAGHIHTFLFSFLLISFDTVEGKQSQSKTSVKFFVEQQQKCCLSYKVLCFIRISGTDKTDNLTCEIIYDNFTCEN